MVLSDSSPMTTNDVCDVARLLKLTTDSLLCIDPKNNVIVKERLITDIRGMDAPAGSGRLIIKFPAGTRTFVCV